MLNHFIHGLEVFVLPTKGWVRIESAPYSPLRLGAYTVSLAGVLFFFRTAGSGLQGIGFPWFVLEGLLFTLICLGVVLTLGLLFIPCVRFASKPVDDGHAMKLALYSATPIWIWGVFQLVPVGAVRTTCLLLSLGHASWLMFTGLIQMFGMGVGRTLVFGLIASALWVLGLVVLTQVFLKLAFTL
jgi:hypothetical protein